jgi:hypothetical protein
MVWMTACLIASVASSQTKTEGGAIYFAALALGYIAVGFIVIPEMSRLIGQVRRRRRQRRERF